MLVATCPSREELLDYAVGKLSDEAAESLAGHLDSCANCQAELAALSDADDSLVARLRGPLPSDPIIDEPECTRAVARARAIAEGDTSVTNLPRLLGEYQLLERLGSGGMGTVYKALHTKLGRVVALKVLTRARTHDPAAVARFEREMQAVGQLDHRHIVRAHDAREIDGTPILVMEYLDGLDLGEIVRRLGALDPKYAAELARQTAVGLQTIYEHGQVHRDIKPSNLMLTADGDVKILDLGLARLRPDVPLGEEMTATGQGMGTADYMAPEQASDSRAVDIRADIYSLGCTLYKLLTGRAPFSGPEYRTALDKMNAHVHAAPPPVRDFAPAVPEGLATIVDRMLAKTPANRFATPAEVADALSPYCTGADLASLLKRAATSPPLPPGDGSRSRLPSGTNSGRHESKNLPSPSGRGAGGEGRHWKRFAGHLVLLLMAGGFGFALAIILRIHKDGKDSTVDLPNGSTARIDANGQVDVTLPGTTKPVKADNLPATQPQIEVFTIAHGDAQKLSNMLATLFSAQATGSKTSPVPLRFGVDTRTNQVIVSGTKADLDVVEAILSKLDDGEVRHRPARPSPASAAPALPDGTNARVGANGQVDFELPKGSNTGQTTKEPAAVPFPESSASGNLPNPFTARGQAGEIHAYAPLPTVRVTHPVVCDVCDYEEYTGQIGQKTQVRIEVPVKGVPVCPFKQGTVVQKGDLLAEIVSPEDWPRLQEKGQAVNRLSLDLAGRGRRGGRGGRSGSARAAESSKVDVEEKSKSALAEWKLARGNTKTVKILAPCAGTTSAPFLIQRGTGGLDNMTTVEAEAGERLVTITESDSMEVTFEIDQPAVLTHRRMPDRKPNWEQSLPVVIGLADEKGFPYRGKVIEVTPDIDPNTHTQHWRAVVSNKDGLFMPGMSVRVRLITGQPHNVMLIPDNADKGWDTGLGQVVGVLNDRNSVELRKAKLGREYDGLRVVNDAINGNDWVITSSSAPNLRDGTPVKPEKFTTPPPPWASVDLTPPPAPPSVSVAHPVVREVTDYQDFTGRIEAAQTAEIRARASGNLDKVCFKPGMSVKQGDLLFEIDPRLYQAESDQAAGAVKQAQIRLNARKVDFDRIQVLAKNKAVSQEEIDQAKSQRDEAVAAVQTAEAALNVVHVRLEYTKIAAPFAGNISRSSLDVGNLVTADKTVLATLASTDPMYVYFDIDERTMLTIRRKAGRDPALSLPVSCGLPDEQGFTHRGKMDAADSRIDPATGTARWRAVLPNQDGMLSPGMFVRVRLETSSPFKAVLVPERSLSAEKGRIFVLLVNDQNVTERRDVMMGRLHDGMRVVTEGLSADDWVITPALKELRPGTTVTPDKAETPAK